MQNTLFDAGHPAHFEEHDLGDALLREYPGAFSTSEADALLERLIQGIPWQGGKLRIGGRDIPVPRLQCWMGDRGILYSYSGMRLQPRSWSPAVLEIRRRVQSLTGREFNSVLLNYYRNGQDSVAWHADDETELGPNPVIASVSLGAERPFQLRHRRVRSGSIQRLLLRHGSVLLMGKTLQNNWLHQLPKVRGMIAPRVNLTFRRILGS